MHKSINLKIAILSLIFYGALSCDVIGQFTILNTPELGPWPAENIEYIAFADKLKGNFSVNIYYSPSSGTAYRFYQTQDGGETWDLKFGESSDLGTGNHFIFASNSETCFVSYRIEPFEFFKRVSEAEQYSFFPQNTNIIAAGMTKLNDSVFYLIAWHTSLGSMHSSHLYKIEGDSINDIYSVNWNSLQMIKAVFVDPDTGFVISKVASNGEYIIRRTTDAGLSWENCFYGDSLEITDIAFFNHSTGIISCSAGRLYRTEDAGTSWTEIWLGMENTINCLSIVNETVGYCGGDYGSFYETSDSGLNWNIIPFNEPFAFNIINLQMLKPGFGFISNTYLFVKYDAQVGIGNLPGEDELIVSPNPTEGLVQLNFKNGLPGNHNLSVINCFGQIIESVQNVGISYQIDLSVYPSGIYFFRIFDSESYHTIKIIKK